MAYLHISIDSHQHYEARIVIRVIQQQQQQQIISSMAIDADEHMEQGDTRLLAGRHTTIRTIYLVEV